MTSFNKKWFSSVVMLALLVGCGDPLGNAKDGMRLGNKYNVAKLRTCCVTFASENNGLAPESKEALLEFMNKPYVSKSLERIGLYPGDYDSIFTSERDGEPFKVKWGSKVDPYNVQPLVFEAVGVDGVRFVAAGDVMEVGDSARYDRLWEGKEKVEDEEPEE